MHPPRLLQGEGCCPKIESDPLYTEHPYTKPVNFHSFRRAFNTALAEAGVNVQRAMHLAGHHDAKTHQLYVMKTDAMKRILSESSRRCSRSGCSTKRLSRSLLPRRRRTTGPWIPQSFRRWADRDSNRGEPLDSSQTAVDSRSGDPARVDVSARSVDGIGPTEMTPPMTVEDSLAYTLSLAAKAQRWDVVAQLARELEARRLAAAGIVSIASRKDRS